MNSRFCYTNDHRSHHDYSLQTQHIKHVTAKQKIPKIGRNEIGLTVTFCFVFSYISDLISLSLDWDGLMPLLFALVAASLPSEPLVGDFFLPKTLIAPLNISRNQYSCGRNSAKILILHPRGNRQKASKNGKFTTWL